MDISQLPQSQNINDRRNSWIDHLMTIFAYPLRSQNMSDPKFNGKLPQIAADFPMRTTPSESEGGLLAQQAGYNAIVNGGQNGILGSLMPNGQQSGGGLLGNLNMPQPSQQQGLQMWPQMPLGAPPFNFRQTY